MGDPVILVVFWVTSNFKTRWIVASLYQLPLHNLVQKPSFFFVKVAIE